MFPALFAAVEHVARSCIPGDVVDVGPPIEDGGEGAIKLIARCRPGPVAFHRIDKPGGGSLPIALLRIRTAGYRETHEALSRLYPRLVAGGVLVMAGAGIEAEWAAEDYLPDASFSAMEDGARYLIKP